MPNITLMEYLASLPPTLNTRRQGRNTSGDCRLGVCNLRRCRSVRSVALAYRSTLQYGDRPTSTSTSIRQSAFPFLIASTLPSRRPTGKGGTGCFECLPFIGSASAAALILADRARSQRHLASCPCALNRSKQTSKPRAWHTRLPSQTAPG
jgi:hypothetical protein